MVKYPQEFREKVVKLMQVGDRGAREVAEEFGISSDSVWRWLRQAKLDAGSGKDGLRTDQREELRRLRRGEPGRSRWSARSCQEQRPGSHAETGSIR